MRTAITIKIGGKAGEGIKTTGLILSKIFSRFGFKVYSYDEYPSLVRGGHNTFQMYADIANAASQHQAIDILIALDHETVTLHQSELNHDSVIIFDPNVVEVNDISSHQTAAIPLKDLAQSSGGSPIMANMVALGAVVSLCGLPTSTLFDLVEEIFQRKGIEVVEANKKAVQSGFDYVKQHVSHLNFAMDMPKPLQQLVLTGNEAIGLGAIAAGVKYFAAYPMTPATSVLHFLADYGEQYGVVVNHSENEIAAVNTCLGASMAGIRTMTATSGGGFCLMVEGMGMAGIAEIPLVIVLSMRPGPATGMPTWTGQADIRFVIHASQDEFPRLVVTPGDVTECFTLTKTAVELSEKYQIPVVIAVDKVLSESYQSCLPFASKQTNQQFGFADTANGDTFKRYAITPDGISPRAKIGQRNGAYLANAYEHDELGWVTEDNQTRVSMMDKRMRKMTTLTEDLWDLPVYGNKDAKKFMIGFGSTLGPALEALKQLPEIGYIHCNYVWPFPAEQIRRYVQKGQQLICLEGNHTGQLESLLKEHGIQVNGTLRKYDGRPFYPEEIVSWIRRTEVDAQENVNDEKYLGNDNQIVMNN